MRGKLSAVEGVAAGVALEQRGGLLGRAVLLLDDALNLAVGAQLDAAVAEGVGWGHGHDGAGELAGSDGLRELGDGVGGDERQVAVEHDNGALRDAAGSSATFTAWPVPRRSVCSTHSTLVALLA